MPLSIYQILLRKGFLQTEFHPRNNSIIILYENGELQCISSEGKEAWSLSFSCKPIVFRINAEGDLLAILGKEELIFYDLLTKDTKRVNVNEKMQLLEFYKNSVVLSGFQKSITFIGLNGRTLKTISFDHFIRQFKVAPLTNNLLIYNQNQNLVCTDMDGNVQWLLERLIIHDEILVSKKGQIGYFVMDTNVLIQFDVHGESFYEIGEERPLKYFSISWNGKALLVLNFENTLIMFDEKANKIWDHHFEHTVKRIKTSPKGDLFLTVDSDEVLSCYSINSSEKERGEFFEFKEDKRIFDKESTWTMSPGRHLPIKHLRLLSVNASGHGLGLIGLDGNIHFYDEQGTHHFDTSFPAMVDLIGISDSFHNGYVYGEREILVIDFRDNKKKYIIFDKFFLGRPLVNYYHQKIFLISKKKELLIYDFEGHLNKTVPLQRDYQSGINCEAYGIILFDDQGLAGFSDEGKIFFRSPLKDRISDILYHDHTLLCCTKNYSLFFLNLSNLKGKKRELKGKKGDIQIFSTNPLLVLSGKKRLHHLDRDLSTISIHQIESPDSHFFFEGSNFYEIIRGRDKFYCYNENRKMVWRYISEERIRESALMRNGLVFLTQDSIQYIGIKDKEVSQKHFSQFLEI